MSVERITKNVLTHEPFPFTSIFNEMLQGITNTAALGVYCYLASKPSGWIICKKEIQKHFKCGRDHINSCFKYLKEIGAIEIQPARGENGKISCWNTLLKRHLPTIRETHIVDNPHCGNTAPIKERILEKKEDNKKINTTASSSIYFNQYKQDETKALERVNEEFSKQAQVNKFRTEALSDEKSIAVYDEKFQGLSVTLEELYDECADYWSQQNQMVYKARFLTHLKKTPLDKYKDFKAIKSKSSITADEKDLIQTYCSLMKARRNPEPDMIKTIITLQQRLKMTDTADAREALAAINKAEEISKSNQFTKIVRMSNERKGMSDSARESLMSCKDALK